jgi:hypothetical protein
MQPTSLYGALLISKHAVYRYEKRLQDQGRGDAPDVRQRIRGFIEAQRAFQEQVGRALASHPRYGPALEEQRLADAFRLLQTWDWLSLLLLTGPLPSTTLRDVPVDSGQRIAIKLVPRDGHTMTLDPYPFSEAPFVVRADGRWMAQQTFRHNALFRRALHEAQVVGLEIVIDRIS